MDAYEKQYNKIMEELKLPAQKTGMKRLLWEESIPGLTTPDINRINGLYGQNMEQLVPASQDEKAFLDQIRDKKEYRMYFWQMRGTIRREVLMKRYQRLLMDYPVLRTRYFLTEDDRWLKIQLKYEREIFPVKDMLGISENQQLFSLKNIIAARLRHNYEIERDPALDIRAFQVAEDRMTVLFSWYELPGAKITIRDICNQVFPDFTLVTNQMPKSQIISVPKIHIPDKESSLEYWNGMLLPLPEKTAYEGEQELPDNEENYAGVYQFMPEDMTTAVKEYADKHKVSVKAILLTAWGVMQNRCQGLDGVLVPLVNKDKKLEIMPIRINLKSSPKETDMKILEAEDRCLCGFYELKEYLNIALEKYFLAVHNFMDFSVIDSLIDGEELKELTLFQNQGCYAGIGGIRINYHLYGDNIGINYIYNRRHFAENSILNYHRMFISSLSELIYVHSDEKYDSKKYIFEKGTGEEQLVRLGNVQKALYLKKTGLFEQVGTNGLIALAEQSKLMSFLEDDIIQYEKKQIHEFIAVGEGKIEVSCLAEDGLVKSLRILKEGDIFGIEALLEDNLSSYTYTVLSDAAKLVIAPEKIMNDFLCCHPELWKDIYLKEDGYYRRIMKVWD